MSYHLMYNYSGLPVQLGDERDITAMYVEVFIGDQCLRYDLITVVK
jgi:hypothetical protein